MNEGMNEGRNEGFGCAEKNLRKSAVKICADLREKSASYGCPDTGIKTKPSGHPRKRNSSAKYAVKYSGSFILP